MTQKDTQSHAKTALGNTETSANESKEKRIWFFTWNNYTKDNINVLLEYVNDRKCDYMFQEEKGSAGTPHLQGVIGFRSPKKLSQLHDTFPKVHWEVCRSKKDAINYCCKKETRNGKQWFKGFKPGVEKSDLFDPIKNEDNAYIWQERVIRRIKQKPDPRSIIWIVDAIGGKGKSVLCKHLCIAYDAVLVGARTSDMKYAIATCIENDFYPKIIVVDLPYSVDFDEYEGLEEIKNGMFFNGKYKSGMCLFDTPHIVVFSNRSPNVRNMGKARFDIIHIKEEECFTWHDIFTYWADARDDANENYEELMDEIIDSEP